jgi:hypothetical protein
MSMPSVNLLPIPEKDLERFSEGAARFLTTKQRWRPGRRNTFMQSAKQVVSASEEREVVVTASQAVQEVVLLDTALRVGDDEGLFNEDGLHILHTLRRGMAVGLYMGDLYQKQVGFEDLTKLNRDKALGSRATEFQQKTTTVAAIQLFVASSYVHYSLSRYKTAEVEAIPIELEGVPEVSLLTPAEAFQCFIFYLGKALEVKTGNGENAQKVVKNGPSAIKMTLIYLGKVLDELKLKIGALMYTEPFVNATYKLETEDFTVQGFETQVHEVQVRVNVNPIKFEEMVGNRAAKHNALRATDRLSFFDFKMQLNPYVVAFGDVPLISMGKGMAGTGKTMMAGAKFTRLQRNGDNLGFVPLYWELPKDMASEFQGKSAKQMTEWMRRFSDTSRIIYGVIDDAEGVLKNVEGNRSAESTEGIISVFLTFTEGAAASRKLNWLLDVLTNLPEKIYQPVMSRIQDKYDIEGAITVEDFLDQDWLWRQKIAEQDKAFDDMKDPESHVYMGTQGHLVNLSALYDKEPIEPREGTLRKIFEAVRKEFHEDEHMFYAQVFAKIKEAFPTSFSSRDVRNIQVAINNRRTDFDVDPLWLEKREAFADKPFDERVRMLRACQQDALKGLTLKTCRLQETVRYLNVLLSIPENARQREVNEIRDGIIKGFDARLEANKLLVSTGRVKNESEAAAA